MASELLVEIGTEELPPKALRRLSDAFRDAIVAGLGEARLDHGEVSAYATPRRLAVKVANLDERQADVETELKGPPVRIAFDADGQPTRAAAAFADKCGVAVGDLERIDTPKGEWLVHRGRETGQPAANLLPDIVIAALHGLPIPKRMRWGSGDEEFVRPVHWVVLMLDGNVVPGRLFGIATGRETRGHRFHAPGPFTLASSRDYPGVLETSGFVRAQFDKRRAWIVEALAEAARSGGGTPIADDELLDEVTALVEWPVVVEASFETRFLSLPPEVLIATLQSHQRYFPLRDADGELLPRFVAMANLDSRDPEAVREGNERVVRPRLADAAFFWDTDRKRTLASRRDELKDVIFQKNLGTVFEKTVRVAGLAAHIAECLGADPERARRAAELAKCDLVTNMVGEFPELQGIMGRYYAEHDGEPDDVATALEEQYLPRFAGDHLPTGEIGACLSLAEKLDTLAGIFAIGQRPTGTRDPFGLRRAALGVLRILIEGRRDVDLAELVHRAVAGQPRVSDPKVLSAEVFDYIMDRLRAYYHDGIGETVASAELFEAVFANRPASPLDFHQRLLAVQAFSGLEAAASLAAANKRVANILRKSGDEAGAAADAARLELPEESALFDRLQAIEPEVTRLIAERHYKDALLRLAELREPVDAFFDAVMVMDEDPVLRANRLALLARMHGLFMQTADLSRLAA